MSSSTGPVEEEWLAYKYVFTQDLEIGMILLFDRDDRSDLYKVIGNPECLEGEWFVNVESLYLNPYVFTEREIVDCVVVDKNWLGIK